MLAGSGNTNSAPKTPLSASEKVLSSPVASGSQKRRIYASMPSLHNDSEEEENDFQIEKHSKGPASDKLSVSTVEPQNDYLSKFETPPPSKRPRTADPIASAAESETLDESMEAEDVDVDDERENIVTFVTPSRSRRACLNGFR